jgi:hypothetical protein
MKLAECRAQSLFGRYAQSNFVGMDIQVLPLFRTGCIASDASRRCGNLFLAPAPVLVGPLWASHRACGVMYVLRIYKQGELYLSWAGSVNVEMNGCLASPGL